MSALGPRRGFHCGICEYLRATLPVSCTVVAYASRTFSKSERKYCVMRKELLSAVKFIQHFSSYLLGNPFVLRTDHGSLTWLQNFKEPESQLAHWIEQLQEYHFEVVHRAGERHSNADAMSRRPCNQCHRP